MDYKTYINNLDKVSIEDIMNIIEDNINNGIVKYYGFRKNMYATLFGEIVNGILANPSVFTYENADTVCEELFKALNGKYPDGFNYSYAYSPSGEYNYIGYATDGTVCITFPNINYKNNAWIANHVYASFPRNKRGK